MSKQVAVTIDPNGPPLTIEIVFDGDMGPRTVVGTYDYYLWAVTSSAYIDNKPGNNVDSKPDMHPLPLPNTLNTGRMIEVRSHFSAPDKPDFPQNYLIKAVLRQGNEVIGEATDRAPVSAEGLAQFTQLLIKMN